MHCIPLILALHLSYTTLLRATATATADKVDFTLRNIDAAPVLHFTLARRGGTVNATAFPRDYVVLSNLAYELEKAEGRFNLTKREVKGNKLVRKAKVIGGSAGEGVLMGEVAGEGTW